MPEIKGADVGAVGDIVGGGSGGVKHDGDGSDGGEGIEERAG